MSAWTIIPGWKGVQALCHFPLKGESKRCEAGCWQGEGTGGGAGGLQRLTAGFLPLNFHFNVKQETGSSVYRQLWWG